MSSLSDIMGGGEAFEGEDVEVCTLLCDGDIVAYRPAAACDGKYYEIKGVPGRWKYKKDVLAACIDKGLSPEDITSDYDPEPEVHATTGTRMTAQGIERAMSAHWEFVQSEHYLTESDKNFRLDINPTYKANRDEVRRPKHLGACKQWLIDNFDAKLCGVLEADDMISVRATELRAEGKPYVVCSIDKDFNQIPGWHYNWVNDEYWYIDDEMAREFLWKQVCVGDKTDNIFAPEGIGPAKANKLFANTDWATATDDELYKAVTSLYIEFLSKCGKAKKDRGVQAVTDFTDVRCWVEETMSQVFLLRARL